MSRGGALEVTMGRGGGAQLFASRLLTSRRIGRWYRGYFNLEWGPISIAFFADPPRRAPARVDSDVEKPATTRVGRHTERTQWRSSTLSPPSPSRRPRRPASASRRPCPRSSRRPRVGAGRSAVFAVEAKQNKKARTILVRRRSSPPLRRPAPRVRSNRTNPPRARDPDARARLSRRRDRTPRGRVRPPARADDARAAAAIAKNLSAGAFSSSERLAISFSSLPSLAGPFPRTLAWARADRAPLPLPTPPFVDRAARSVCVTRCARVRSRRG